jgi:phosphate transport system substrate-binding protein
MPNKCCAVITATAVAALAFCATTACWAQATTAPDAITLRGAGSTFAAPLYRKWIEEFTASHRNVSISYDPVGSGEGVRRFLTDAVDFAGSDEILNDSETAKAGGAIMVPVTAGMIVIAYNIPGVSSGIKLPRDVYLDIFAGVVRQWDDPRIQAANPGIAFPHRPIGIVARLDGSGTTAAFTHHLDAIGSVWRGKGMKVGKLVDRPNGTTLAPGNEGVASKIHANEGSIGYVEFWYARQFGLQMATLQKRPASSLFLPPTPAISLCPGASPRSNSLTSPSLTRRRPAPTPSRRTAGCCFIHPTATERKRRRCGNSWNGDCRDKRRTPRQPRLPRAPGRRNRPWRANFVGPYGLTCCVLVSFGSKAEILTASTCCPLYPRKQTFACDLRKSAWCQEPSSAQLDS